MPLQPQRTHTNRRSARRTHRNHSQRRLLLESLESRRLMAIVAYEGFEEYTAGEQLENASNVGLNGGTGWVGAFGVDDARRTEVTVVNSALTYPGATFAGDGGARALQFTATEGATSQMISRQFPAQTGSGPLYLGFLYRSTVDNDASGGDDLLQVGLVNTAFGNPLASAMDRNGLIQLRSSAATDTANNIGATPLVTGQTYFFVLALEKTGASTTYNSLKLYVNPTSALEPATPYASRVNNSTLDLSSSAHLVIRKSMTESGDTALFDEFRIGTTFADALPPPPPVVLGPNDILWDGSAGDGQWDNPANWAGDNVPNTATEVAVFGDLTPVTVDLEGATYGIGGVRFANSFATLVNGTLNVATLSQEAGGNSVNAILGGTGAANVNVSGGLLTLGNTLNTLDAGDTITINAGARLLVATSNADTSGLGAANVVVDGGEIQFLTAPEIVLTNALDHYGYHSTSNALLNLDVNNATNSGGYYNGGNPSAVAGFFNRSILINGPLNRGLDFNNDADFIASGAVGVADNYNNLWIGYLVVGDPASGNWPTGNWSFGAADEDDNVGIWIDRTGALDQFNSNNTLTDANGDQLTWDDNTTRTVSLTTARRYLVAFTHREGTGSANVNIRVTPPGGTAMTINPGSPAQAGMWEALTLRPLTLANNFSLLDNATFNTGELSGLTLTGTVGFGNLTTPATVNTVVAQGELRLTNPDLLNDATVNSATGTLILENLDDVGGTFDLTKNGAAYVILPTNNASLDGDLAFNGGTAFVLVDGALGTAAGSTTVGQGATLEFSSAINYLTAEPMLLDGTAIFPSGGTFAGPITVTGSDGNIINNGGTLLLPGTLTVDAALQFSGNGGFDIDGQITGSRRISKAGTGTLTPDNVNNDFTGGLNIEDGRVFVRHANALGSTTGVTSVLPGASLIYDGLFDAAAEPLIIGGAGENNEGALRAVNGSRTISASITVASTATITAATAGNTLTLTEPLIVLPFADVQFDATGNIVVEDAFGNGISTSTIPFGLNHFGYHSTNLNDLNLNANGGMFNNGNPTGFTGFVDQALLTTGPGGRGLDFNDDTDFINTGAVQRADNYTNLWIGKLTVTAATAGDWTFSIIGDDDQSGIWLDSSGGPGGVPNDIFESTGVLGDGLGEQLQYLDAGSATVNLQPGEYMVAFTHREGSGGSNVEIRVRAPSMTSEDVVRPADAAQQGFWKPLDSLLPLPARNGIIKNGAGTLTFGGDNTYDGLTQINAGTLRVDSATGLGLATGGTRLVSGAAIEFNGSFTTPAENITLAGAGIGGTGAIVASGNVHLPGRIGLSGDATLSSTTGTLRIDGVITKEVDADLTFIGAGNFDIRGAIANGPDLDFSDFNGRLFANAGLGITGETTFNNLAFDSVAMTATVTRSANLSFADDNAFTAAFGGTQPGTTNNFTAVFVGTVTVAQAGDYYFAVTGNDDAAVVWLDTSGNGRFEASELLQATIRNGTTALPAPIALLPGTYTIAFAVEDGSSGSSLTARYGSNVLVPPALATSLAIVSGASTPITGTNDIVMNGTGALRLSGNNSYDGQTLVNAGMLVAGHSNALGSAAAGTTVLAVAKLALDNTVIDLADNNTADNSLNVSLAEPITLERHSFLGTASIVNVSGNNTITGSINTVDNSPPLVPITSGLELWFDASNLSSIVSADGSLNNGDFVAGWNDTLIGGNSTAQNALAATPARQPIWVQNSLNGRPAIRFAAVGNDEAASDDLQLSGVSLGNNVSIFVVVQHQTQLDSADSCCRPFFGHDGDAFASPGAGYTLALERPGFAPVTGGGFRLESPGFNAQVSEVNNTQNGSFHVYSMTRDGTTPGGTQVFQNGVSILTGTSTVNVTIPDTAYSIGGQNNSTAGGNERQYRGDIPEIIAFDRTLSPAERQTIEAYLNAKYFSPVVAAPGRLAIESQAGTLTIQGPTASAAVEVRGAGNTVISSAIADAGGATTLTKDGTGALSLANGSNSYTGGTTVVEGRLLVTNGLVGSATGSGNVAVQAGGTLGGEGTVSGSATIENGAALSPGLAVDDTGVVRIGGNLDLQAGSTTVFDIDGVQFDQAIVTGNVTIADGQVIPQGNIVSAPFAGQAYVFLNSTGTVTGALATLPRNAAGHAFSFDGQNATIFYNYDATNNQPLVGNDIAVFFNTAPIAVNDAFTINEETTLTGNVLSANPSTPDSDPENDPLTNVTLVGPSPAGAFSLGTNGAFTYTPPANFAGVVQFQYTVTDSQGAISNTATVTITVVNVNDPLIANSDGPNAVYTTGENTPLSVNAANGVLVNDSDADANQSFILQSFMPTSNKGATVSMNADGSFSYNPNTSAQLQTLPAGATTTDTFTYTIASVPVFGAPVTSTQSSSGAFAVSSTDLLQGITPVATGSALAGHEGTSSNPAVLTNGNFGPAAVVNGETLTISNDTTLTFALDLTASPTGYDISQIDTYSGWRDDGRDNQNYTVRYSLVSSPDVFTTLTTVALAPNPPPSGKVTIAPASGTLLAGVARIQFVFGGQENTFAGYREIDVLGTPTVIGETATATVTITVNGVNDIPVAVNDNFGASAGAGNTTIGNVLTNDIDVDMGATLSVTQVNGAGNVGTPVTLASGAIVNVGSNGSVQYNANGAFGSLGAGQTATDSFTYTITDGNPVTVGTPTVATQTSAGAFAVSNSDLLTGLSAAVTGPALGAEGTSSNSSVLTNGAFGTPDSIDGPQNVAISSNTTLMFTLDTIASPVGYDISSIETFSGWQDDGRSNQNYTVRYATVDNPNTFVTLTTVGMVTGNNSGKATISPSGGQILATRVAKVQFDFGAQQSGHVGYRELDVFGVPSVPPASLTATATITVTGANDAPTVAANNASVSGAEGQVVTNSGTFSDPDIGDSVTISASVGTVTQDNATGTWNWSLTTVDGASGPTSVTITARDAANITTTTTFTYSVTNVDPTLALSGAATADEGTAYTLNLAATDPGTDTISQWTINWGDGNTQVATGNPSSVTHVFADGPAAFVISATATDEDGTYAAGNTVSVTVNNVAPTVTISGAASANEGTPYTLTLSATDVGADAISTWTINWGDGTTQVVVGNPSSVQHTYANGPTATPLTISATATDEDGTYTAPSITVAVNNLPPTPQEDSVEVLGVPQDTSSGIIQVVPGLAVTFVVSTSDPAFDPINNPGTTSTLDAPFKFLIRFGDGQTATGEATEEGQQLSFTHTYSTYQIFQPTLVVTDRDGGFNNPPLNLTRIETVQQIGIDGTLYVAGSNSSDRIIVQSGSGGVRIRMNNRLLPAVNASDRVVVFGGNGNDTISVSNINVPVEFYGGAGDDYLAGGSNNDILDGGPGRDRLLGGGGDDQLYGGAGNDSISGGLGIDIIYGDSYLDTNGDIQLPPESQHGRDNLSGDIGDDIVYGEGGNDTINGGVGDDLLRGGDGLDKISGDNGNDVIAGDAGSDKLYGRAGNDVLIGGGGIDQIYGGSGDDLMYGNLLGLDSDDQLNDILALWAAGQQQDAVDKLKDESSPAHDGIADVLYGEGGSDWYLLYFGDKIATAGDKNSGNTIETLT